jgi:hypothetical protein
VAFLPVFLTLGLGQASLVILALLTSTFFAARNGHFTAAGILLACSSIKPQYVIPLVLVFLVRRNRRVLASFGATVLVLVVVPVPIFGPSIYVRYVAMLRQVSSWQGRPLSAPLHFHHWYIPTSTYAPQWNHSLAGFTELLLPSSIASLVYGATAILLLGIVVWSASHTRELDILFAFAVVVGLLIAPHSLAYDDAVLLLPGAVALRWRGIAPRSLAVVLVLGYIAIDVGYRLVFAVPVQLSVLAMLLLVVWFIGAMKRQPVSRPIGAPNEP